jgi:alkanesulfonate monooxygenase SsuD/methylene tetrahydromethanopterin reductase-like flavin-dependent oxidoreductase (luciferase family)
VRAWFPAGGLGPGLTATAQFAPNVRPPRHWLADQVVPIELPVMEAWTTLSALAANTERIRLGTLVTNVAMRNPAIVARQANTVLVPTP